MSMTQQLAATSNAIGVGGARPMTQAPIVSKPGISQSDPQGSTHKPPDQVIMARACMATSPRRRTRHTSVCATASSECRRTVCLVSGDPSKCPKSTSGRDRTVHPCGACIIVTAVAGNHCTNDQKIPMQAPHACIPAELALYGLARYTVPQWR